MGETSFNMNTVQPTVGTLLIVDEFLFIWLTQLRKEIQEVWWLMLKYLMKLNRGEQVQQYMW